MFIVKKKRRQRARSSIGSPSTSGRGGSLSPTNPVRLGTVPLPRGARTPFQRDTHPSQHSMHSTGWVAHSDQRGMFLRTWHWRYPMGQASQATSGGQQQEAAGPFVRILAWCAFSCILYRPTCEAWNPLVGAYSRHFSTLLSSSFAYMTAMLGFCCCGHEEMWLWLLFLYVKFIIL